jgi:hypothetical protein
MGKDDNIPQGEEGEFFRDREITIICRLAQACLRFGKGI